MPLKLPESFKNAIVCEVEKTTTIRSSISTIDEIKSWVKEFSELNKQSFILRSTKNDTQKLKHYRLYECHHASYRKPEPEENKKGKSKNYHCRAKIKITVKNDTKKTRKTDKYIKEGLLGLIVISHEHTHNVDTREAHGQLRPTPEQKEKFTDYFEVGLSIARSMEKNESDLNLQSSSIESANAQINAKYRTVRYWHSTWLTNKFGSNDESSVLQKLKIRCEEYGKKGISILINENPYTIVIITPLMRRAHSVSMSKDIVFGDSTASCDTKGHAVTLLLTPCAIGAIPLGVVITRGQTKEEYKAGLQLVERGVGGNSFGGQMYPHFVMTDDSVAERSAFQETWPDSILLLCRFHVCQAVWRWLTSSDNCVPKEKRPHFYQDFSSILTSRNKADATVNFNKAAENGKIHCFWSSYLQSYWDRKEEWCLAWRDEKTHGHQTNNFSEISVRLLKDKVLDRFKAYNEVELVDKICEEMDAYYVNRLKNFVNGRDDSSRLLFQKERKKAEYLTSEDVVKVGDNMYIVRSEKEQNTCYHVDPRNGFCSCAVGKFGKFCKHMAGVFRFYEDDTFSNLPPITPQSRYEMAVLAFGSENVGDISEYFPLELQHEVNASEATHDIHDEEPTPVIAPVNENESVATTKEDEDDNTWKKTKEELLRVFEEKLDKYRCEKNVMEKCLKRIGRVSTRNALETFLSTSQGHVNRRTNMRIKVQTTSAARRKIITKQKQRPTKSTKNAHK